MECAESSPLETVTVPSVSHFYNFLLDTDYLTSHGSNLLRIRNVRKLH